MKIEIRDGEKPCGWLSKYTNGSYFHNWITARDKWKPKKDYFMHSKSIRNITIYQECSKCKTRRILYKGDWREWDKINIDTDYFITCTYEEWMNKQGFEVSENN